MKKEIVKLNLGSGPSGLDSWLNFDWGFLAFLSKFRLLRRLLVKFRILPKEYLLVWPPIELVDIRRSLPLKDQSVKYIYCSHVLEHFEYWQVQKIFKECRRVLTKDGWMRIIVPDVGKMIKIYQADCRKNQTNSARDLCRLWWGYPKDLPPNTFWAKIGQVFIREHRWHYDMAEMKSLLIKFGFSRVVLRSFQKGEVPDLKKLDLPQQKNHSLYLEVAV